MIYWINKASDNSFMASARSYEQALSIQDDIWKNQHIDTIIVKDEGVATN